MRLARFVPLLVMMTAATTSVAPTAEASCEPPWPAALCVAVWLHPECIEVGLEVASSCTILEATFLA